MGHRWLGHEGLRNGSGSILERSRHRVVHGRRGTRMDTAEWPPVPGVQQRNMAIWWGNNQMWKMNKDKQWSQVTLQGETLPK